MLYLLVFVNVREYTTNDLPFWGEVFFTCLCIQYLIFHLPIKFDLKKKKKHKNFEFKNVFETLL
jgi:hypothetical protein